MHLGSNVKRAFQCVCYPVMSNPTSQSNVPTQIFI